MEVKKNVYEETEEDVKWVKHYSSMHQILLVGEGDFSFSLSLAKAFGSAFNIVATSHDSYDILLKKYSKAQSNVEELMKMGAAIIHEVDATKMKPHVDLRTRKFDRIVFNFPHAGFKGKEDHPKLIKLHRQLVRGFFKNASRMLWPYGEVHVSHKTAVPFSHWNLEELAAENSLLLVECADFCIQDYPGYNNKRGDGSRSDIPFPLGKCSTFKFIIGHLKKKNPLRKTNLLPSSPSISPIIVNRFGYGNIADMSYPEIPFPTFKEIPFPVNFELMIPRTINSYEFRETPLRPLARPPFCRINQFSLRMHEPQFSTFTVPLTGSYNEELLEAPRRASLGYNYWSHYEEIRSRRVSMLECGRMLERQVVLDEETRQRWLYLCHGI